MSKLIKDIEAGYLKKDVPEFDVGDTVKVHVLIREGKKERVQAFEGIVIAKKGRGLNATFTVRRIFQGVGVERTFMVHAPKVQKVKVVRRGKTRRSKLYYLRNKIGSKATRLQEDQKRQLKAIEDARVLQAEQKAQEAAAAEEVRKKAEQEAKEAKKAEKKAKAEKPAEEAPAEKPAEEAKAEEVKKDAE